jgi:hypothetical protein
MPQIESWPRIPAPIRNHLIERVRGRNIDLDDLNQLRVWWRPSRLYPQGRGTRISVPSNYAVRASIPKPFFLRVRLPPA